MLHYLSEDPWPLAYTLGVASLLCLVILRVTKRGKFLIWGLGLAALTLGVFGLEAAWVTDAERIEAVVYDLAEAVEASDVDRVLGHLAPEATLVIGDDTMDSQIDREALAERLRDAQFDFVQVSHLVTHAGALSRAGTAEFRVRAMGSVTTPYTTLNYATPPAGTQWSLGFREDGGAWKVTRITPIRPPADVLRFLGRPGSRR